MRNARLPVKLVLIGFVVICGLTTLIVPWVITASEKPKRIEILQAAQKTPDSPPGQGRPLPVRTAPPALPPRRL